MLLHLVLGLKVSSDLARLQGICATSVDLDTSGGFALALQLEHAEVVSLAEHILGGLAEITIHWGSHCLSEKSGTLVIVFFASFWKKNFHHDAVL